MADGSDKDGAAMTGEPAVSHAGKDKQEAAQLDAFGLHCLRKPASDTCVIFVHGILSSGETAWGKPSWPELLKAEPGFEASRDLYFHLQDVARLKNLQHRRCGRRAARTLLDR